MYRQLFCIVSLASRVWMWDVSVPSCALLSSRTVFHCKIICIVVIFHRYCISPFRYTIIINHLDRTKHRFSVILRTLHQMLRAIKNKFPIKRQTIKILATLYFLVWSILEEQKDNSTFCLGNVAFFTIYFTSSVGFHWWFGLWFIYSGKWWIYWHKKCGKHEKIIKTMKMYIVYETSTEKYRTQFTIWRLKNWIRNACFEKTTGIENKCQF